MFTPWQPLHDVRLDMPQLAFAFQPPKLVVEWRDTFGKGPNITITFGRVASLLVVDESTCASASDLGLPLPEQFETSPERCHVWREAGSGRKALFGDLGALLYEHIDTYYIVGGNVVLLIDVTDAPEVAMQPSTFR